MRNIFNKIFGRKPVDSPSFNSQGEENEHAVIISFKYGLEDLNELFELGDKLDELIEAKGVGEYDGHDIAVDLSEGSYYMYGPNAETLFQAIESTLMEASFMKGAVALLRFGPPEDNVREIELVL